MLAISPPVRHDGLCATDGLVRRKPLVRRDTRSSLLFNPSPLIAAKLPFNGSRQTPAGPANLLPPARDPNPHPGGDPRPFSGKTTTCLVRPAHIAINQLVLQQSSSQPRTTLRDGGDRSQILQPSPRHALKMDGQGNKVKSHLH